MQFFLIDQLDIDKINEYKKYNTKFLINDVIKEVWPLRRVPLTRKQVSNILK